jgi:hypothetical protein
MKIVFDDLTRPQKLTFSFVVMLGIIALAFISGMVIRLFVSLTETNEKEATTISAKFGNYVKNNNCQRTGFAGSEPEAIYKCDNGIWLETELVYLSNRNK